MMNYLFVKYRSIVRENDELVRCLQPRITITRLNGFIFGIVVVLFLISYFLLYQKPLNSPIIFLNNINYNSTFKPAIPHRYSFLLNEPLVKEYVSEIIDKAQPPATCLIIIRSADGAIGNRIFLFASAYGLARLHQCELYVAPWILKDLRSIFTININSTPVHLITDDSVVNRTDIYQRYSACTLFDDLLRVPLNPNLTTYEAIGFYQAYGYFVQYKHEITYLLQFNQAATSANVPLVEQLLQAVWKIPLKLGNYTKENVTHQYLKSLLTRPPAPLIPVTWIAVHIRRGDFLTFFRINTSLEYLNLAMDHYRRKYMNCRFLIASDDKPYVKLQLGNNSDVFVTPSGFHSGDDLAALALCEHTIVTAGSYGWWAAWLAGGNVIHDLTYPVASQNCIREHYFPPWFVFPHNSTGQKVN